MQRIALLVVGSSITVLGAAESEGPGVPAPAAPGTTAPGTTPPAPGKAPDSGAGGLMGGSMWIMVVVLGAMWLLLMRPQQKEEKRRKELIAALKRGDKVVTIGGLHGEVAAVGETTIDLRVGESGRETVLTFNKSAVSAPVVDAKAADAAKGK